MASKHERSTAEPTRWNGPYSYRQHPGDYDESIRVGGTQGRMRRAKKSHERNREMNEGKKETKRGTGNMDDMDDMNDMDLAGRRDNSNNHRTPMEARNTADTSKRMM